ncbi:MAG: FtsW/RodA/SpoVE family cell cycle protein [Clostridiales bacterium]|nr:FtsW/RodA/SpoVE family cell cycle protein [Clostridiales bacterium]
MAKLLDRSGWKKIDWLLIANIVALVIVGLISITAATADPATGEEVTLADKIANLNFSTVWRQCVWFLVGVVAMVAAFSIDYNYLKEITPIIYWINIIILLMLFALATATNNTVSWYKFGNIGFQPSELAKISTILMLSRALSARTGDEKITSFREFFHLVKYAVIPFFLIAVQPDLGTAMVVACITIGLFFVARVDKKIVLSCIGAVAAILPVAWLFMKDYQRNRILVFFGLAQEQWPANGQRPVWHRRYEPAELGAGKGIGLHFCRNRGDLWIYRWINRGAFIWATVVENNLHSASGAR